MSRSPVAANEAEPLLSAETPFASSSRLSYNSTDNRQPRDMATAAEHGVDGEKLNNGDQHSPTRSSAMIDESEEEGSSLYEKKCVLINRELDAMGMGRYQW
jgi:hypothetical protein